MTCGSGGGNSGGRVGGGALHIIADSLDLNGTISSNAGPNSGSGAGGAGIIYIIYRLSLLLILLL